jgi:hypothetical protein
VDVAAAVALNVAYIETNAKSETIICTIMMKAMWFLQPLQHVIWDKTLFKREKENKINLNRR